MKIKDNIKMIIGVNIYDLLRKIRLNLSFMYKEIIYRNKTNLYSIFDYKFYVRDGTDDIPIINEIFRGEYKIPSLNRDNVIDIGGHVGSFSIRESKNVQKVYTFEPNIDNFNLLKKNIEVNKIKNIYIYNLGIANQTGKKNLFMSPYSTGAYSIYHSEPTKFHQIDCINLEEFIKMHKIKKIDLIKLDCEGAEYEILFNLSKNCFKHINEIVMECHNLSERYNHLSMETYLKEKGYNIISKKNDFGHYYIYANRK